MDRQLAFVLKEEILRNVIKTHNTVLLAGWEGTGKTVTALKACRDLGDVVYFNAAGTDMREYVSLHCESAAVVPAVSELADIQAKQSLFIIDGVDKADGDTLSAITGVVSGASGDRKVILITRMLLDTRKLFSSINVVIRFKQDTAEVLLTDLCDLDNL